MVFFIQLFFIWLKENGIFDIWKMEKRNEDEYLLRQSYNFILFLKFIDVFIPCCFIFI